MIAQRGDRAKPQRALWKLRLDRSVRVERIGHPFDHAGFEDDRTGGARPQVPPQRRCVLPAAAGRSLAGDPPPSPVRIPRRPDGPEDLGLEPFAFSGDGRCLEPRHHAGATAAPLAVRLGGTTPVDFRSLLPAGSGACGNNDTSVSLRPDHLRAGPRSGILPARVRRCWSSAAAASVGAASIAAQGAAGGSVFGFDGMADAPPHTAPRRRGIASRCGTRGIGRAASARSMRRNSRTAKPKPDQEKAADGSDRARRHDLGVERAVVERQTRRHKHQARRRS